MWLTPIALMWHPYGLHVVQPYGLHMGSYVVCTRLLIWFPYDYSIWLPHGSHMRGILYDHIITVYYPAHYTVYCIAVNNVSLSVSISFCLSSHKIALNSGSCNIHCTLYILWQALHVCKWRR